MGRSPCCEKAHTNKGAWTQEEDQRLIDYIRLHGEGGWRALPKSAGLLRCGKSCRLRWMNYLRPDLKRGNFTQEEDELLIKLHSLLGNKWSLMAARLPGRTDNEIKNYWNTHIKRKLISRGLDPQTHRPLNSTANAAVPGDDSPENMGFTVVNNLPMVAHFGGISQTIDFKKNRSHDHLDLNSNNVKKSDSCNSGTTTDEDQPGRVTGQYPNAQEVINLELSIGLSQFQGEARSCTASSAESRDVGPRSGPFEVQKGYQEGQNGKVVCLCCQLGFEMNGQGQGGCSNCQTKGGYFYSRYIGPLGS